MAMVSALKVQRTRTSILDAAKAVLRSRGYAALSTREVARAAGVPLSQIHYHFGSKQGLILALFEYLNAQLLARQHAMFGDKRLSLSAQWDRACDYLDEDLASGYVRVLQELWAAGWSDPAIAEVVRRGIRAWCELLTEVAERSRADLGTLGPFAPAELAAIVAGAFVGAESFVLLGAEDDGLPIRDALRRVAELIRRLESAPPAQA